MATLKDQIDGVCKELKVTVKEGGLIAQVKAAAELCGLEYTTLKDTAAALVKEVLGESEDAPAAAGDGDGDAVLTKVRTAEQRAAESQAKAVREGRVQEIDDDEEPVSSPPAKKPKKEVPKAPATPMRRVGCGLPRRGSRPRPAAATRSPATTTPPRGARPRHTRASARLTRTVNGTGHTGPSEFCATSI